MKSDVRISLLPISCLNFSLSFISLSSDGRVNFPFEDFFGDLLCLSNECTTFSSRSLFPFDCELKIVGTTDSLATCAPVSWKLARLSTDSWSRHCFQRLAPKDPNIVGTVLDAVCLLLLKVPECRKPSGSVVEITVSSRHWKLLWLSGRLIGVCSSFMQL